MLINVLQIPAHRGDFCNTHTRTALPFLINYALTALRIPCIKKPALVREPYCVV